MPQVGINRPVIVPNLFEKKQGISTMNMPKRTPLRDRLGGLLDYSFVDERDQRARDQARLIGGVLSPI